MDRMTRQKSVILEEIRKLRNHPTADEIYAVVRQRLPRISLGTVYRNLNRLSEEGLIRVIETSGSRRYDGDIEEHSHVRCTSCGKIGDSGPMDPLSLKEASHWSEGFMITGYHIEYLGVCDICRAQGGGPGGEGGRP